MKPRLNLSIDPRRPQLDKKYAGDPDSPTFQPPSPLIDRQVLPYQLEEELKRVCGAVLAKEQSSDNDLGALRGFLGTQPPQETRPQKHDKHASFTFQPLKPYVPEMAASYMRSTSRLPSRVQIQRKPVRQKPSAAVVTETPEPPEPRTARQRHGLPTAEDEALQEIRSRMDSRPKTSAAACIDYAEKTSSPRSNPSTSIQSSHTTYSTPFTSADITPDQANKSFSRSFANAINRQETETTFPKNPHDGTVRAGEETTEARTSASRPSGQRRLSIAQHPYEVSSTKASRDRCAMATRSTSEIYRPPPRAESIRNSIRNYIRPRSSNDSIRSSGTIASTRSRTRQRMSALKSKISHSSFRSRASSRQRPGYDDGDEYFIDPDQMDLDRPLPPLPALDSYRDKPKHISLLMKSILHPSSGRKRNTRQIVIDDNGLERTMTTEEETRRRENLARAVLEKMSSGSIGSGPTSPTGVITLCREGVWLSGNSDSTRPNTSDSGPGLGAVPLYRDFPGPGQSQTCIPGDPTAAKTTTKVPAMTMMTTTTTTRTTTTRALDQAGRARSVRTFMRRWSGRFGWNKKGKLKAVSVI